VDAIRKFSESLQKVKKMLMNWGHEQIPAPMVGMPDSSNDSMRLWSKDEYGIGSHAPGNKKPERCRRVRKSVARP